MFDFFSGIFTPDPGVVDGILALLVLYILAVWPLRKHLAPGAPLEKGRVVAFVTGVLVLILAVATPIDTIGESSLFSVHMLQHVILMFILPPFLIWGCPNWLIDFALRMEGFGPILRFFTKPVVACFFFNFLLILWHIPSMYEFALRDSFVHLLEHVCYVVTAIAMYWPLLEPGTEPSKTHPGVKLLYILAVSLAQLPLFAALCFSEHVLYPTYAAAPRITDLSPLEDQILGGVIMKITAILFTVVNIVVCFYRWAKTEPRS